LRRTRRLSRWRERSDFNEFLTFMADAFLDKPAISQPADGGR
jgi:hypothetical protein